MKQQLSESHSHGSAADTDKSMPDNPAFTFGASMQDEEQLRLSTQQAAFLMQQLSTAQSQALAADTDKVNDWQSWHDAFKSAAYLQDEEQLKLSMQQAALLKQQLSEAQCESSAAEKQVQGEQMQLQRLERRLATLQTQAEDQTSQTR